MYWVIGSNGQRYGPVQPQTLATWVAQGRVTPETLIENQETGERVVASQMPLLQGAFSQPPVMASLPAYASIQPRPGVIQVYPGTHSVGTAILLALLITGLGQVYNKQGMKGLVILMISVILAVFTCGFSIILTHPFAFIDALLIAQRLNRGEAISEWQSF